jgi:glycosyltransferase involved in cell wall biosynthesis
VLAIVPAFDEAASIAKVIEEIRAAQPEVDVVVIDDCSRDDTARLAREAGAAVISLPVNLGIGGAVQTGFKYAVAQGHDAAVQVDGDGQHDASQLDLVLAPLEAGTANVVIGSRFLADTGYRASPPRRAGMLLFGALVRAATGQRITDTTSGFRALDREAFAFLARNYPVDFPDAETLVLLRRAGFRLMEVSVRMRPRPAGRSTTTPIRALYYPFKQLVSVLAVLLRKRPEA